MFSNRLSVELAAALGLGVAQLGSGLLLRLVSRPGVAQQSTLSYPPVVVSSEIIKLLVSTILYYNTRNASQTSEKGTEFSYELGGSDGKERDVQQTEKPGVAGSIRLLKDNLSTEAVYGLINVAAAYMIASGASHPISSTNESGLCGLIRASVVMTTAILMMVMLRTKFAAGQLSAIVLLMCGAAVLQFSTPSSVSTTFTQSSLLVFQTVVLASASVYNQKIYQRSDGSFHAMNMVLFGASALLNAVLLLVSHFGTNSPLAITDFGITTLVSAILTNVVVGIASAAVLKYHDALVMYFILSLSTGFLLCLEQFFTKSISLLAIPGAGVILLATYQYFLHSGNGPSPPGSPLEPARIQLSPRPAVRVTRYLGTPIGVAVSCLAALALSVPILHYQTTATQTLLQGNPALVDVSFPEELPTTREKLVTSPFKNTVAFIRVNNYLPQREKLVREAYAPYFHTVHVSMPDKGKHQVTDITAERDYWDDGHLPYSPVRALLNLLLEKEQADAHYNARNNVTSDKGPIEGMLYFHFDGWVEPLAFHDMPMEQLWILNSGASLPYKCMRGTDYRQPGWIWFRDGGVEKIKKASSVSKHLHPQFDIDTEEFCMGWSDLYYVPQRFFQDYITLTGSFGALEVMHEVALPTIWRIIERTHSNHPSESVVMRWGDCWGGCCEAVKFADEVLENRCGHKLDYLNWDLAKVHYERLEKNTALLGKPWPTEKQIAWENWVTTTT